MGDISAEPSMEEILSSIKRIIAEEGDGQPVRGRRPSRAAATSLAPPPLPDDDEDEVLELSDPIPAATPKPDQPPRAAAPVPEAPMPAPSPAESIVSREAVAASRGSLEALSRLMVKPEPGSDGSLEGLVRELLRPMLREWLDAHLPEMVETMVNREIARIAGQAT